ncbi:hypothetical protein SH412_001699 [Planctellipticum variicoloris]|nr:hypothetical protein SH412_001699 [Planctomycetaceae bacterium SH412]
MWSTAGTLPLLAGMILVVPAGGVAEDDVTDEGGTAVEVVRRAPRLDEDLFELWVFGGNANRFRQAIVEQLETAVETLDWKYGLSTAEREKLALAGRADIRRFFEQVEVLRREYRETRGDHRQLLVVHRKSVALRLDAADRLFDARSFFAKVASATLKNAASNRASARRQRQLRSAAERAIVPLESIASLRPEQSEALVELLLAEEPPINVGGDDDVLMKYRLTEFSEEQMRPLFDEAQWPRVQAVLNVFHNYRAGLEARGLIDGRTGRLRTD